jgi:hypothetical protein
MNIATLVPHIKCKNNLENKDLFINLPPKHHKKTIQFLFMFIKFNLDIE